ncbi:MAG: DNA polymerase IV [Bacilli bacterium]
MKRLIFHVDVNNAFLSWTAVYLLKQGSTKDIRKVASIIGGDEETRKGIVLAKSPVAKKLGIKTAMPLFEARRLCKNLEIYPPNFAFYKEQSIKVYEYLATFTPLIEQASIDESYLDMTGMTYIYDDPLKLAYEIKTYIREQLGFTVNIGIGNNKLCAKMASDFEKPDKVHTLFLDEVPLKMWPLPVNDLFMVGKKSALKLNQLGIKTIGDLAKADETLLKRHFKTMGAYMKQASLGLDNSVVENVVSDAKCISTLLTFPNDTDDITVLKKMLLEEATDVGRRLRKQDVSAKCVTIIYKKANFISYSHQATLINAISTTNDIYKVVNELLLQSYQGEMLRAIGIRLSTFVVEKGEQLSLFDNHLVNNSNKKVQKIMDEIKDKYGDDAIMLASFLKQKDK